jgi:hypothetical protein
MGRLAFVLNVLELIVGNVIDKIVDVATLAGLLLFAALTRSR